MVDIHGSTAVRMEPTVSNAGEPAPPSLQPSSFPYLSLPISFTLVKRTFASFFFPVQGNKNAFSVTSQLGARKYLLMAKDDKELNAWVEDISKVRSSQNPVFSIPRLQ